MRLHPHTTGAFLAVLLIKPANERAGGKAGTVNRKVGFYRPQRPCGLFELDALVDYVEITVKALKRSLKSASSAAQ
jgi:hypothetical protein